MNTRSRIRGTLRGLIFVVALVSGMLVGPSGARAFRTAAELSELQPATEVRWRTDIRLNIVDYAATGMSRAIVERAVRRGLRTWRLSNCDVPAVEIYQFGDQLRSGDGLVSVAWITDWRERGLSPQTVATTDLLYEEVESGVWSIVDADILVNANTYTWTASPTDERRRAVDAVISHEFGHALGLLHPCEHDASAVRACEMADEEAVMNPRYNGEAHLRLSEDDEMGLCVIYGGTRTEPPQVETDAGPPQTGYPERQDFDPCSSNFQCISGHCADGYCRPACNDPGCTDGIGFGERCTQASDCGSGVCVTSNGNGHCSRTCEALLSCPEGRVCREIDNISVCTNPLPSGTCSAQSFDGYDPGGILFLILVLRMRRREK